MPDIHLMLEIDAPVERVYQAISTPAGLSSWWTDDASAHQDEIRLGFENGSVVFRFLTTKAEPPNLLEWECVGDGPEWPGTKLSYALEQRDSAGTTLRFTHRGWTSANDYFRRCAYTWPHVFDRLKRYAEMDARVPLFTSTIAH